MMCDENEVPFQTNDTPDEGFKCHRVFTTQSLWNERHHALLIEDPERQSTEDVARVDIDYKIDAKVRELQCSTKLVVSKPYNPECCLPNSRPIQQIIEGINQSIPLREEASLALANLCLKRKHALKEEERTGELLLVSKSSTYALMKSVLSGPTAMCRNMAIGSNDRVSWLVAMSDKVFCRSLTPPSRFVIYAAYKQAVQAMKLPKQDITTSASLDQLVTFSNKLLYNSSSSLLEVLETFRAMGNFFYYKLNLDHRPAKAFQDGFWFPVPYQVAKSILMDVLWPWFRNELPNSSHDAPFSCVVSLLSELPLTRVIEPHLLGLGIRSVTGLESATVGNELAMQICAMYFNGFLHIESHRFNQFLNPVRIDPEIRNQFPAASQLSHDIVPSRHEHVSIWLSWMLEPSSFVPTSNVMVHPCPLGITWLHMVSHLEESSLTNNTYTLNYKELMSQINNNLLLETPFSVSQSWAPPVDPSMRETYYTMCSRSMTSFQKAKLVMPYDDDNDDIEADPDEGGLISQPSEATSVPSSGTSQCPAYCGFDFMNPMTTMEGGLDHHPWLKQGGLGLASPVPGMMAGWCFATPERDPYEYQYKRSFKPYNVEHLSRLYAFTFSPGDPWQEASPDRMMMMCLPAISLPVQLIDRLNVLFLMNPTWHIESLKCYFNGCSTQIYPIDKLFADVQGMCKMNPNDRLNASSLMRQLILQMVSPE